MNNNETRFHDTETTCHCGANYNGSDHCPECYCEQHESLHCDFAPATPESIKELFNGQEEWTNAFSDRFGERVCVLFDGNYCVHEGVRFEPRSDEIMDFWNEYNTIGEGFYLTKELEEEFGKPGTEKFKRVCEQLGVRT